MESFQPGRLSRATLPDSAQSDLTGVCVRNSEGNQTVSERILSMDSAHFLDLRERKKKEENSVWVLSRKCETFRSLHLTELPLVRAPEGGERREVGAHVERRQKKRPIFISDTKCVYWLGFDAPPWWMVGDITLKNRWADAAYACQGILAGRCCVEG